MTEQEYRAVKAVNISSLKNMAKSGLHYQYGLDNDREDTRAMFEGRAFHMAILEPDRFKSLYMNKPEGFDGRTVFGKQFMRDNADKEFIDHRLGVALRGMQESIRLHPDAASDLARAVATELPIFWIDAETGLPCKAKIDELRDDGAAIDWKKTARIEPALFFAQAYKLNYHVQAAFYVDGLIANGIDVPEYKINAVEGEAPFDVAPYRVPEDILNEGRAVYHGWLRQVADYRSRGLTRWPGVVPVTTDLALPGYARWQSLTEEDFADDISGILEGEDK